MSLEVVKTQPEWPAWAPKICEGCGSPRGDEAGSLFDPFTVFGVARKFHHDADFLRKRFYELSRALHPDRFSGMDEKLQQASLDRMCQINLAYQTLRNPDKLRSIFFDQFSISIPKVSMPFELAEEWFDLQDSLSDGLVGPQVQSFSEKLAALMSKLQTELKSLECDFDLTVERSTGSSAGQSDELRVSLSKMAEKIAILSTMVSLKRDFEAKIRQR